MNPLNTKSNEDERHYFSNKIFIFKGFINFIYFQLIVLCIFCLTVTLVESIVWFDKIRVITMFDFHWVIDKYKSNYDPEYWDLCRTFMLKHRTKYPEQKLVLLTEAFYQIGVYGSSYDPKTTRMVSALGIDVLEDFLKSHPGALKHPFIKSSVVIPQVAALKKVEDKSSVTSSSEAPKTTGQSSSIWDTAVDCSIIANVLLMSHLKALLKGFVIIYDIRRESTMNDNKVAILEESFKRSKMGPCHWDKEATNNNVCPIRLSLKWKGTVLAEAIGSEEKALSLRLAQALLSKIALFSHGIEAKWSYYRDGRMPDLFDRPNTRRSNIYKVLPRSQFKAMAEITSFIDTFANSDSFAEIIFGMDYNNQEKKEIMEYITKSWGTRLTYRTVNKLGAKSSSETHVCMYQIRTGEELRRWLDGFSGENERYRLVPPGNHRRAGSCDENVREVLKSNLVDVTEGKNEEKKDPQESLIKKDELKGETQQVDLTNIGKESITINKKNADKIDDQKDPVKPDSKKVPVVEIEPNTKKLSAVEVNPVTKKDTAAESKVNKDEDNKITDKTESDKETEDLNEENLEKLLEGFVLFYDAKKNSEIDKDDWFSALCDSFKMSKFGALNVTTETVRALRTRCTMKWKNMTLASAEGLTDTQAKTAATLQLISKLEPFTYIIQAKEEYFNNGKIPPFIENPDPSKSEAFSIVRRKDLPSYYSIFQKIDDYSRNKTFKELIFGSDFTWELKNEIVVYLKAKGLDYRYFTVGDQKPWTHLALYHIIKPDQLKEHLLKNGGENEKYKLIPPPKSEVIVVKTTESTKPKETVSKKPIVIVADKRKRRISESKENPEIEIESNKIQIKLKNFKKDKVEYPEDTGGDFPGLILWVGFKKNSTAQKSLFFILIDSFRMSKYGELVIEESEENVWGKKVPMKKCVIKSSRKVLAVGLGETKTEAKNSAALQILRQLRKHCYAIQAKESYFKDGKATPYDFNPDPKKSHVYRVVKRTQLKERASIIKYVDDFAKKVCSEEVIFGDDFTNDERESILYHCRQLNLNYRLMKCQSASKSLHTHVAIYHQKPLPTIKAELMKSDGENDMFRLIPPKGKITNQTSEEYLRNVTMDVLKRSLEKCGGENYAFRLIPPGIEDEERDIWPETLDDETKEKGIAADNLPQQNDKNLSVVQSLNTPNEASQQSNTVKNGGENKKNKIIINSSENKSSPENKQTIPSVANSHQTITFKGPNSAVPIILVPHQDAPLAFGPQPQYVQMQPQLAFSQHLTETVPPMASGEPVLYDNTNKLEEVDLREGLERKRFGENTNLKPADRKVYDVSSERKVLQAEEGSDGWSRTVFVAEPRSSSNDRKEDRNNEDLREKLKKRDVSKDWKTGDRAIRANSPVRSRRISPGMNRKFSPNRGRRRGFSPGMNRRKSPPNRFVGERNRFSDSSREERIVRERSPMDRERWRSRSPRRSPPHSYRDESRMTRYISPTVNCQDLWMDMPARFTENMYMYKYVKQDSTTERDPLALLRATTSTVFNIDFEFIKKQTAIDEWHVVIELIAENINLRPLVGEAFAASHDEAKLIAAHHAVDTIQKSCHVIEPNYRYFADGDIPDFIARKHPMKTSKYEIIQNLNPSKPLDRYTVECMYNVFMKSGLEDLFFLATDFSYLERVLVIDVANQIGLWWRLFGPRHPNAQPDDIVSTQHVCVYKQKSVLTLIRELIDNGGSNEKYVIVDPRETRLTQSSDRGRRRVMY